MTNADVEAILARLSESNDKIENGISENFDRFVQTRNALADAVVNKDAAAEVKCVMLMTEIFYNQTRLALMGNKGFKTLLDLVS